MCCLATRLGCGESGVLSGLVPLEIESSNQIAEGMITICMTQAIVF